MSYPNLTADRKFKPKSTSTEYTLKPPSLTTTLCSPQPTINFRSKTAFVWCSQRFDTRNRRKLHTACNPDLANHTTHRAKPATPAHPALCFSIKLSIALPSARRPLLQPVCPLRQSLCHCSAHPALRKLSQTRAAPFGRRLKLEALAWIAPS